VSITWYVRPYNLIYPLDFYRVAIALTFDHSFIQNVVPMFIYDRKKPYDFKAFLSQNFESIFTSIPFWFPKIWYFFLYIKRQFMNFKLLGGMCEETHNMWLPVVFVDVFLSETLFFFVWSTMEDSKWLKYK